MIVLDTNVLSEAMRPKPDERVLAWLAAQPPASVFTTCITQTEVLFGALCLAAGRRRIDLLAAIEGLFEEDFAGRVSPFNGSAAKECARLAKDCRQSGRGLALADAQIAAIAHSRGASMATRNIKDFEACGIALINPWNQEL